MVNQLTIEEQVAQLTVEEKNKILKIGKSATIIGSVIIALMLLWFLGGICLMIAPPLGVELDYFKLGLGIIGGGVIGFAALIAMIIIIKVKYPFYSDKKLSHIKKLNNK